ERHLRHEHLLGCVLRRARMVVHGRLELRGDAGRGEDGLELLALGDVLGQRDLNHATHDASSPSRTASSTAADPPHRWSAPPFTSRGPPRSWNRRSMISKSLGTNVSGKMARASRATSGPK